MVAQRRRGGRPAAARKGQWTAEEDEVLRRHVREHGPREWSSIEARGLLPRNGKSCRLRWVNKLQPGLRTGCKFTQEEERMVIEMQAKVGNKWALISKQLTGRTDNDVKNFWSTRKKKLARMSKAAAPAPPPSRRRSSSSSRALPSTPTESCSLMKDPFQESSSSYHVGESSHQACTAMENQLTTDAQSPGRLPAYECSLGLPAPESLTGLPAPESPSWPSSGELALVPAAECMRNPAPLMLYPAASGDMASADHSGYGDELACLQPVLEFQPIQPYGLEDDMVFDELSPATLDFFDQPPPPPPLIKW
ncbi:probable transcription factor MYB58 [Oryza brachyantha]|uniref:Uncharacterized protein n=1 Tax=Oryza brachyantha TaxID=4533 RepID=J3MUH9_ORYBR|nr:probable transcription factor MYB58 [Oryza brachyantha]